MKYCVLIFLSVLSACSPSDKKEDIISAEQDATSLDVRKFNEMLMTEKDAVLLDVRTPPEVAQGMIPGAIVIDFAAPDFMDKISGLDKDKAYFVYCKAGGRSARTIDQMKLIGFKKLYNLEGGYDAWLEDANKVSP